MKHQQSSVPSLGAACLCFYPYILIKGRDKGTGDVQCKTVGSGFQATVKDTVNKEIFHLTADTSVPASCENKPESDEPNCGIGWRFASNP